MQRCLLYIVLLLSITEFSFSQIDLPDEKRSSFEGRHFYIGFMQNEILIDPYTGLDLMIYIATSYDSARVEVIIPGEPVPRNYVLRKNDIVSIKCPWQLYVGKVKTIHKSLVEINSDVPVIAYAFNSQWLSSDSYTAIPVSFWGDEYYIISMPNDQYNLPAIYQEGDSLMAMTPRHGEFMFMAAWDSTVVTIKPSTVTQSGMQTNREYEVILDAGECYLVKSLGSAKGTYDLTGSYLKSNKPIGVLTGHERTSIVQLLPRPWDSKDHIVEMLMPTKSWGRTFVTIPFGNTSVGDYFRVIAKEGNTVVSVDNAWGGQSINLDFPGSWETVHSIATPTIWHASKPVQIAQFMMHNGSAFDNQLFDPAMVMIPPIEQFVQKVIFQTPGDSPQNPGQYNKHFVGIVANKKALDYIALDDKLLKYSSPITTQNIAGTDYYWAAVEVTRGKHIIVSDSGGFTGIIYGKGLQDSYANVLGASLTNPFDQDEDSPYAVLDTSCGKLTGTIFETINEKSTGIDFVHVVLNSTYNYSWTIDPITDTSTVISFTAEPIDPFSDGKIVIDYRDKNGNGKRITFEHIGISFDLPDGFEFKDTDIGSNPCKDFSIRNTGKIPLHIDTVIVNDPRLSIIAIPKPPYDIPIDETMNIRLCFYPLTGAGLLDDSLVFVLDCDRFIKRPVIGNVIDFSIKIKGHDFGDVLVGETKCDSITIYNTGNLSIRVDSLIENKYPGNYIFNDDILPANVGPGDSLRIEVCFTPDTTRFYRTQISAANDKGKENADFLTGNGIAPSIESVTYDWGERRVGTKNPAEVYLINKGSSETDINHVELTDVSDYKIDPNLNNLINVNGILDISDSLEVPLMFIPERTGSYFVRSSNICSWKLHDSIYISLYGYGTLPEVRTNDIQFGTKIIYSRTDTTAQVIYSEGNEILTVDSLYFISGDLNQFEFSIENVKDLRIDTGSNYQMSCTYSPTSLGDHHVVIGVVNDAMPDYQRRIDEIHLYGRSIAADTLDVIISLTGTDSPISCRFNDYTLSLMNTGNINADITNIDFNYTDLYFAEIVKPTLPLTLVPTESLDLSISLIPYKNVQGNISVDVTINDTLLLSTNRDIIPVNDAVFADSGYVIDAVIGDTVRLELHGSFPYGIELPIGIEIVMNIDIETFLLRNNTAYFVIEDGNGKRSYPCNIVQDKNSIKINTDRSDLQIGDNAKWYISLDFHTLLSSSYQHEIGYSISADDCYDAVESLFIADVEKICIRILRPVKQITNIPEVTIIPNPVNDELKIQIDSKEDDNYNFVIYNQIGEIIPLKSNLYLKKGSHSVIFEVSTLSGGFYVLRYSTGYLKKNIMFIIIK